RDPKRVIRLGVDAIGPSQDVEVVDEGRAHIRCEGVEEARDRYPQHLGLGAVDLRIDLRRCSIEQREDLNETRRLIGGARDRPNGLLGGSRTARGAILYVHLEATASADAGQGGRWNHQYEGLAQRLHLGA